MAPLHQPISHLPRLIHIWEATAQACQVPDHKVQVRKDKNYNDEKDYHFTILIESRI